MRAAKQGILPRQPTAHAKNTKMVTKPRHKLPSNISAPLKGLWRVHEAWRNTPHLANALPRLEQNAQLTVDLLALMPDTLKVGWKAYVSERTLTLKVPHNALAVKIKQMAPLLVSGLQMTGWAIDDMVVRVSHFNQPVWLKSQKEAEKAVKPIVPRVLTPLSASRITESIAHLPDDSPVKAALLRLLQTHR